MKIDIWRGIIRRYYLRELLAVTLIGALLWLVEPAPLWRALSQLTWELVAYLLLLSALLIYISALKWQLFIAALGERVSVLRLFRLYVIGYFVNVAMPSYIGGDLVRSWSIGRKVGQHRALSATIMERYTGLAAMVALALGSMWFVERAVVEIRLAVAAVVLALAAVTFLALSPRLLQAAARIGALQKIVRHAQRIQDGFHLARKNRLLLVQTFALSFLYHSFTVVNTLAAGAAVGWNSAPVWDLFVVLPLILLIGALPIAPNGLGLQEGAFYAFLTGLGATPAQALGMALILRAKSYVLALLGGLLWLVDRESAAAVRSEAERSPSPEHSVL